MGNSAGTETSGAEISPEFCCIYRVPPRIRQTNPLAYTPQMLLIGPLQSSLKEEAVRMKRNQSERSRIELNEYRFKLYMDMEDQKRSHYQSFFGRIGFENELQLRQIIQKEESRIRSCYSESTSWIDKITFEDLILYDAVFIFEFMLRRVTRKEYPTDLLRNTDALNSILVADLILLENQLPYFILKRLYNPFKGKLTRDGIKFKQLALSFFDVKVEQNERFTFKNFTDLKRTLRVRSLRLNCEVNMIQRMFNVETLQESGVKFEVMEGERPFSINVNFKKGKLQMAGISIDGHTELELRNIIALEQYHPENERFVSNYAWFLDLLIDSERDVKALVEAGIITHAFGNHMIVAEMLNKLSSGAVSGPSWYFETTQQLVKHHERKWNQLCAFFKHNYCKNIFIGIATGVAVIVLIFTIIQGVSSIIQLL